MPLLMKLHIIHIMYVGNYIHYLLKIIGHFIEESITENSVQLRIPYQKQSYYTYILCKKNVNTYA